MFRVTPWRLQKKILLGSKSPNPNPNYFADSLLTGFAALFVIQYLLLVTQAYWVCEITCPEWKEIPGSICVLPKAVPITQMTSKSLCLPRFLFAFIDPVPSDPYFGWHSGYYPLSGTVTFLAFFFCSGHLTRESRSLRVFVFLRCDIACLVFSPCQLRQQWRRWRMQFW